MLTRVRRTQTENFGGRDSGEYESCEEGIACAVDELEAGPDNNPARDQEELHHLSDLTYVSGACLLARENGTHPVVTLQAEHVKRYLCSTSR